MRYQYIGVLKDLLLLYNYNREYQVLILHRYRYNAHRAQKGAISKTGLRENRGVLPTADLTYWYLHLYIHAGTSTGGVIDRRLLPVFSHLSFPENFPTWEHLFTNSEGLFFMTAGALLP